MACEDRDVTDFDVRLLTAEQMREAQTVFRRTVFVPPPTDAEWERRGEIFAPGRYLGAMSGGAVIGTTYTFPSSIAVPGGKVVPQSAVSRVGVRADHRRKGIVTELMRQQFADAKAHGEIIATLHASETGIYGRFGYGISTYATDTTTHHCSLRPDVPRVGDVRLIDVDEAKATLPGLYERIGQHRPGMMSRGPDWWGTFTRWENPWVAVHTGPTGDDGYVIYTDETYPDTGYTGQLPGRLDVMDMHAADPSVVIDLWRYVLSIDLVRVVEGHTLPTDNPISLLLTDPRQNHGLTRDELWGRLVDVPEALAARSYGDADPVVTKVEDRMLPENDGTYRIAPSGPVRTDEEPALVMDVDVLAMIYFGSVKPSALARVGRFQVVDADALPHADRLFACDQIAWCGTSF